MDRKQVQRPQDSTCVPLSTVPPVDSTCAGQSTAAVRVRSHLAQNPVSPSFRGELRVLLRLRSARESIARAATLIASTLSGAAIVRAATGKRGPLRRLARRLRPQKVPGLKIWTGKGRPFRVWGSSAYYQYG